MPEDQAHRRDSTPHNLLFALAAETGIVGLVAFAWLMARMLPMAAGLVRRGDALSLGVLSFALSLFVSDLFGQGSFTTQIGFVMWFSLGMVAARDHRVKQGGGYSCTSRQVLTASGS